MLSGLREELVSSGASTTWHDMVLYLIARYAGATAAQEVARLYALQWHQDGLTPYIHFLVDMRYSDSVNAYGSMLFGIREEDIPEVPCTQKATFYTASTAARHAGKVLRDIVRQEARPHRLVHYIVNEQTVVVHI